MNSSPPKLSLIAHLPNELFPSLNDTINGVTAISSAPPPPENSSISDLKHARTLAPSRSNAPARERENRENAGVRF
ncbi:hypothetical protein Lal_00041683 [Lupinus albus]|nr:hypothetical protein Lal_00041683 [Lupinus albus]